MEYNEKLYYLGTLCKCCHEYGETGKSLRYKKQRSCVLCARQQQKEHYMKPEVKKRIRDYRNKPEVREKIKTSKKAWATIPGNRKKINETQNIKRRSPEYREKQRIYKKFRYHSCEDIRKTIIRKNAEYNKSIEGRRKAKKTHRDMRKNLHKAYITTLMSREYGFQRKQIPAWLIKMKAEQLMFTRELRKAKKLLKQEGGI